MQRVFLAVLFFSLSAISVNAKTETGFLNRTLKIGATMHHYQVYVPADWNAKKKTPVILFLHGGHRLSAMPEESLVV